MRCVYCRSLQTSKNGSRTIQAMGFDRRCKRRVSRYRCRACGRYFSRRRERGKRYSVGFKLELARMHVEERMSYRVMAKRLEERFGKRLSPRILCGMVNEVAAHAKGSIALCQEYHPQWQGYLLIDDKYVPVCGRRLLSLVATDASGDALHSELLAEPTQTEFTSFLGFIIERLRYPLVGVTSDFDERIAGALKALDLGHIPHQRCLWHGLELVRQLMHHPSLVRRYRELQARLERSMGEAEDHKPHWDRTPIDRLRQELVAVEGEYRRQSHFLEAVREVLYAEDASSSRDGFRKLSRGSRRLYPRVMAWLDSHLDQMLVHQQDPRLPKTNNIAENINKQLERRFKTIEAFQSRETAWNYQNLIRNYLRFKPYTDCRGARRENNGMAPLEVCGVSLPHHDWLKLSTSWA